MKKPINQTIGDFLAGRGFYIVLVLCVAAVGVSGWYLMQELAAPTVAPVVGTAQVVSPSPSQIVRPPVVTPAVTPKPTPSSSPAPVVTPTPSVIPSPSVQPDAAAWGAEVFTWPVNGAVIASFSVETLLYDETMLDWRIHEGIDLAAEEGTRVLATAAGRVRDVYEDELMGMTVVIDHGDDLVSVYSNLASEVPVQVGDKVYTGDIIGGVGTTAAAESGRVPHLHFAMYQKDMPVDPEMYLPE